MDSKVIDWLLTGDVSIQYQVYRDLLHEDRKELQQRIHNEGWCKHFLDLQKDDGHWALGWYRPKWTCTHYTLLTLKYLSPIKEISSIQGIIESGLKNNFAKDGGIGFWGNHTYSDVCVNGMFLNYAAYFVKPDERFHILIDSLLKMQMKDGGWNCRFRHGAVHSSFHTTLAVLEGLWEYRQNDGVYRLNEITKAENRAIEFLLEHNLFLSHRTKEIVDPKMTIISYPPHWRYNILRSLLYFVERKLPWDDRLKPAIDLLLKKRTPEGFWLLEQHQPGKVHFRMEKVGKQSYWNTLRALKVLSELKIKS